MSNLNLINILTVIDVQSILSNYPNASSDPTKPTSLPETNPYAYLIADNSDVYAGQGTSALQIVVKKEAEDLITKIRWRACTLSMGTEYQCFFSNLILDAGKTLVSNPRECRFPTVKIPSIEPGNFVTVEDNFWECDVTSTGGEMVYNLVFGIVDKTGKPKGYYTWDPIVYIS